MVRFSLFGHTHYDEFHIVKSIEHNKNIGIQYVSGSMTTYQNLNPSFTVIDIDEELMIPLNFQTYYMNVTKANVENKPTWELMHDFVDHYGI